MGRLRNEVGISALSASALFLCSCQSFSADFLPSPWADSLLGACFSSRDLLLTSLYGPNYADHENIVVRQADLDSKSDLHYWITDTTLKINQTKYLLRTSPNDSCLILVAPSVTTIDLHSVSPQALPERITTSDVVGPGFKITKIIYQYNPQRRLYEANHCFRHFLNEQPTSLPCSDVHSNR